MVAQVYVPCGPGRGHLGLRSPAESAARGPPQTERTVVCKTQIARSVVRGPRTDPTPHGGNLVKVLSGSRSARSAVPRRNSVPFRKRGSRFVKSRLARSAVPGAPRGKPSQFLLKAAAEKSPYVWPNQPFFGQMAGLWQVEHRHLR